MADPSTDRETMRRKRGERKSGERKQTGSKPEATPLFFSALGLQKVSLQGDGRRWRREEQQREVGGTRWWSSQAGPSPPSSAPTPGPDDARLRTALSAGQEARDLVDDQDAPMPSSALPAEMRAPPLCQEMRRLKEKDDLDKV